VANGTAAQRGHIFRACYGLYATEILVIRETTGCFVGMKIAGVFRSALLGIALVSSAWSQTLTTAPWFVADELIVALDFEPAAISERAAIEAALFTAAGVEKVRDLSGSVGSLVRLNPGTTFGRAFQAVQQFSFAAHPRWGLRYVQPNYIYSLPEAPQPIRRVFNLSARAEVGAGFNVTIGGMVVPGEIPRLVVFKVRGASLAHFGIDRPLADPRLALYEGQTLIMANDDWTSLRSWEKELARSLCPSPDDEREAMIVTFLDPGLYSVIVSGANASSGIALLEMYLLDAFMIR
jgi:hypothetical protein